jgi:hypothetical protein
LTKSTTCRNHGLKTTKVSCRLYTACHLLETLGIPPSMEFPSSDPIFCHITECTFILLDPDFPDTEGTGIHGGGGVVIVFF